MSKYASILATLCLCACVSNAPDPTMEESTDAVPPSSWQYSQIDNDFPLELALPSDAKIWNLGPAGFKISRGFYTDQGKKTGTGFAFTLADYNGDLPPDVLFDSFCEKPSPYTLENDEQFGDYKLQTVRTECGNLIRYLLIKKPLRIEVYPSDQSEYVLGIVKNILSTAKITPEQ